MPMGRNESLSRIAWSSSESIHASSGASTPPLKTTTKPTTQNNFITKFIGFYPYFVCQTIVAVLLNFIQPHELTFNRIVWTIFKLWISLWVKIIFYLPLKFINFILSSLAAILPRKVVLNPSRKRSVLITNGNTIQSLQLSRNFHKAGFRVVVCEHSEHTLALTRYSFAVSKFYTIPKPTTADLDAYIKALCEIVENEKITYFIAVSVQTAAYFDACVKPHLELRNCVCLCPGLSELAVLDDVLAMLKVCERSAIPIPNYFIVNSLKSLQMLYDTNAIRIGHLYAMYATETSGLRERNSLTLPLTKTELKLTQNDINSTKPWVVVQEIDGEQYLTCTTVKNSRVIANVTCSIAKNSNQLTAVKHDEINVWLTNFFTKIRDLRPINGHVTFRFVFAKNRGVILPLSIRVGVSLPYICYTDVHARLLCSPCIHFIRNNSRTFLDINAGDKLASKSTNYPAKVAEDCKQTYNTNKVALKCNCIVNTSKCSLNNNTGEKNSKDTEEFITDSVETEKTTCMSCRVTKITSNLAENVSKTAESSKLVDNEPKQTPSSFNPFKFTQIAIDGHENVPQVSDNTTNASKQLSKVTEMFQKPSESTKPAVEFQQSTYRRIPSSNRSKSIERSRRSTRAIDPIIDCVTNMTGNALDKRSAIFNLWDPLPYCVYFYVQVPLEKMLRFLRRNKQQLIRPMTTGVR